MRLRIELPTVTEKCGLLRVHLRSPSCGADAIAMVSSFIPSVADPTQRGNANLYGRLKRRYEKIYDVEGDRENLVMGYD